MYDYTRKELYKKNNDKNPTILKILRFLKPTQHKTRSCKVENKVQSPGRVPPWNGLRQSYRGFKLGLTQFDVRYN